MWALLIMVARDRIGVGFNEQGIRFRPDHMGCGKGLPYGPSVEILVQCPNYSRNNYLIYDCLVNGFLKKRRYAMVDL